MSNQVESQPKGKENIWRGNGDPGGETGGWQTQALCRLLLSGRLVPRDGRTEMKSTQPVDSAELDSPPVPTRCGVFTSIPRQVRDSRFSSVSGKVTTYVLNSNFFSLFSVAFYPLLSLTSLPTALGVEAGWGND